MTVLRAPAATSGRADAVVAATFPELSRSRAAALVKEGAVRVDGVPPRRVSDPIAAGASVEVEVPDARPAGVPAQDLELSIVYQDDDVVVIDKAAGMVVHPSAGHEDGTLVNALLHHVDGLSGVGGVERPGIVHRLDRGTSGLLVVAKHDHAHRSLSAQFADHSAGRTYLALVLGVPRERAGTVRSEIGRHPTDRVRMASVASGGRLAVTHWETRSEGHGCALVQCVLETGRTHQIRVHLCERGHPLVGDPLYRRKHPPCPPRLLAWHDAAHERPQLHAWRLRFAHPRDGRPCAFEAPPPADFIAAVTAAGLADALPVQGQMGSVDGS
jgi:23S rRNA pseudouridine1911/1915/1917 synthase